ncbi:MAG TPA: DUF1905 domain-containing protein [Lutibacter sp.]|nr:DUF1905 domain-containing protein [Lutibacter sp.]
MEFKFESSVEKFEKNQVWSYHFSIPDAIAKKLLKEGKRLICTINKTLSYQTGLLSAGDLGYFVNVNTNLRKEAGILLHDKVTLQLKIDKSKYGLPIPRVFKELLKQDPDFDRIFHNLTSGKQRALLHKIGSYKNENTQLEKLMILRFYLIQVKGKLDFKELYTAFKKSK